jgi:hypothetical protein
LELAHIPACFECTRRNEPVIYRYADDSHLCDVVDGGTTVIAVEPFEGKPVLKLLHERSRIFSAQALFSRISGERCVHLGETVSGATGSFWTRSR